MKVLHVFTLFSTAQIFFDGQFKYLTDKGYQIHLVTSRSMNTESFVEKNCINFNPIEIKRRISPFSDVKSIWKLCKYIKKEKIDIVIGHTPKGALIAMISSFILNVHHRVYYRHGLIYTTAKGIKRNLFKNIERLVSSLSTTIINVSPSLSNLAIVDNLNREGKQLVLGKGTCGGIDAINKFNPKYINETVKKNIFERYNLSPKNFIIGFCGRICRDKGIVELINGFELFNISHRSILPKLLLIGNYDERDILPASIHDKIENNPNIIVTGYICNEIQYYYSLLDVFVFPSYREGFGISVIEASAMEKPVLVSKSHGCIDSMIDNTTGLYVELTPEDICEKISFLLDENKRKELGENGRRFVLDNFDKTIVWPLILKEYKKF